MEFSVVKELDQAVFLKPYSQLVTPKYADVPVLKHVVIDGQASLQPTHGCKSCVVARMF